MRTWWLEWRVGKKVRSRPLGPVSEEEADQALAGLRLELRAGRRAPGGRVLTPSAALVRFLNALEAVGRKPRTIDFYREKLGALFAEWDQIPMAKWDRLLLEDYLSSRRKWAPRTKQMVVLAAKRFIGWADEAGVTCPDFVGKLKGPTVRVRELDPLTKKQTERLLQASRDYGRPRGRMEVPVHLALLAGLSLADIRGLTWPEVDLKAGAIVSARAKTGRRIEVPLHPTLERALRRHRGLRGAVCRGLPKTDSALLKMLHNVCRRAKVPAGGWTRLRHTFATRLDEAGVDHATMQRLMAHRPGSPVTMRYVHSDRERMRDAVERALG